MAGDLALHLGHAVEVLLVLALLPSGFVPVGLRLYLAPALVLTGFQGDAPLTEQLSIARPRWTGAASGSASLGAVRACAISLISTSAKNRVPSGAFRGREIKMPAMSPRRRDQLARALGARIRALRAEVGLTQEKLAWDSDLAKAYLSQVEAGKRTPSIPVLCTLAERLGVEAADLLALDLEKPRLRRLDAPAT